MRELLFRNRLEPGLLSQTESPFSGAAPGNCWLPLGTELRARLMVGTGTPVSRLNSAQDLPARLIHAFGQRPVKRPADDGDVDEVGAAGFDEETDLDGDGMEVAPGVRYNPLPGAVSDYTDMVQETGVSLPAPGETAGEQWDRRLNNLWAARDLAIKTQFAIGVDETDMLYALGLVNEIELALIMMFRQSVPERGRRWDEYRRQKEIYVRMVRKNRIQRNIKKERAGLKGFFSRVRGDKPMSARDMVDRLIVYVDDMEFVMDEGRVSERLMRGVRDFMGG